MEGRCRVNCDHLADGEGLLTLGTLIFYSVVWCKTKFCSGLSFLTSVQRDVVTHYVELF